MKGVIVVKRGYCVKSILVKKWMVNSMLVKVTGSSQICSYSNKNVESIKMHLKLQEERHKLIQVWSNNTLINVFFFLMHAMCVPECYLVSAFCNTLNVYNVFPVRERRLTKRLAYCELLLLYYLFIDYGRDTACKHYIPAGEKKQVFSSARQGCAM